MLWLQVAVRLGGTRVPGNAVEITIREQALGERREDDATDPLLFQYVEEALRLDPAVEHVVAWLMDETWRAELAQNRGRAARLVRFVLRDAGVERLTAPHRLVERAHRLLEGRVGVEPVRIVDVDVVDAE